ncbi:hypothetical protein CcCBS67573_g08320 [Chytriomyces confervae]|uniref:UspA domain-containing protein n=1 Tax=Chytriomyces confervae TaxID=246404 RepID=A0A507ENM7_9FUNG|nr:hypothetical protein CcCBS67573_g08320 [Chytriomyces confervae]
MAAAQISYEDELIVSSSPNVDQAKRTVVITVDGSDASAYAVEWSVQNLLKADDHVVLLHCHQRQRIENEVHAHASQVLQTAVKQLPASTITTAVSLIADGVGLRLSDKIAEIAPDCVVCGTSVSKTAVAKALHGSISDYLVHTCTCAVIVPKAPAATA